MTNQALERRIAALERELTQLRGQLAQYPSRWPSGRGTEIAMMEVVDENGSFWVCRRMEFNAATNVNTPYGPQFYVLKPTAVTSLTFDIAGLKLEDFTHPKVLWACRPAGGIPFLDPDGGECEWIELFDYAPCIPVDAIKDGGVRGGSAVTCTWTYSVTIGAATITGITPIHHRQPGMAYYYAGEPGSGTSSKALLSLYRGHTLFAVAEAEHP